jgi:hypothetical protein
MATSQQPSSQSTGNVTPAPEQPTYSDFSGAIFSIDVNRAQKSDKENADNWEGQTNGILLFVRSFPVPISMDVFANGTLAFQSGIFSTVATFIAISYPNLQEDPGAVRVLTLTCALIATLMQQWARRYLQMVQRIHTHHVSAQIREYFVQGTKKFGIHPWPQLQHICMVFHEHFPTMLYFILMRWYEFLLSISEVMTTRKRIRRCVFLVFGGMLRRACTATKACGCI